MEFFTTLFDSFASEFANTSWFNIVLGLIFGSLIGLTLFVFISPITTRAFGLKNDPQKPNKIALLTEVRPGQTKIKIRQGRVIGFIRDQGPDHNPLSLWYWFDRYVWYFGLRLIGIPPFQTLETYNLPRFEKREEVENGREASVFFSKEDRSDHVRTLPFTFFFIVSGAEVQTVPFTVKGSIQARILKGPIDEQREEQAEYKAFFNTDSWGVFLNQALTAVIRGVVRSAITLDDAIGKTEQELWKDTEESLDAYHKVSERVFDQLRSPRFILDDGNKKKTISELIGLEVLSVEIIDFEPEVSPEEAKEIRAPIRGRQKGRGRTLEGQGEGEYQEKLLAGAAQHGELGHTGLTTEAIVRASKEGKLDALIASLLKNMNLPKEK